MNIFEMMRTGELHPIWFGIFMQGVALGVLCFLLARSKNRNFKLATIIGFIPMLNYLAVLYYVGVPKLEQIPSNSVNDS